LWLWLRSVAVVAAIVGEIVRAFHVCAISGRAQCNPHKELNVGLRPEKKRKVRIGSNRPLHGGQIEH